jgi:dTDP-4-amino-4,6-dideoxygalactose transaminase
MKNEYQMVDLKNHYLRYKNEFDESIQRVLTNSNFIGGSEVSKFSELLSKWMGSKHVIPCANGTDALQISYMALGLNPGDQIIIPSFNYIAATESAILLGLVPILVDVDPYSFNMDLDSIRKSITPKTKAIVAVHLFGQSCNLESIDLICKEYGIFLIEDNAQSLGSEIISGKFSGKKSGTIGLVGTTSFFPSKILGCMGDGGAIFCQDDELAEKIRMIANHGQSDRYNHEIIGINSRLDSLQAAILNVKMKYLSNFIQTRQFAAKIYNERFSSISEIETPCVSEWSTHVYHQYTLKFNSEKLRNHVHEKLIESKIQNMMYYPKPTHLQKAYQNLVIYKNLPISEYLSKKVLSLPIHSEMNEEIAVHISKTLISFI